MSKILVIGAGGQVGTELVLALRAEYGLNEVIATDIRPAEGKLTEGPFELLDAMDAEAVRDAVERFGVRTVYLMAAMLSATAEKMPMKAWQLNMDSLFHVLELAKEGLIDRVFWPSSIAVFGPDSQKVLAPQKGLMEPTTIYGISKSAGELLCRYYHQRYGVDVRSVRYPGLIGYRSKPGGGTTDYAVHIFHHAIQQGTYECFLSPDRTLPMMYMDDAIEATIGIMKAYSGSIKERTSYNIAAMSFSPAELASAIQSSLPRFTIRYSPDERDALARTWPDSIDDSSAREDWGWKPRFDLESLVGVMLQGLSTPEEA